MSQITHHSMIINDITINNFQSYYKDITIEFGKGLNLIIGNGGKGKSKLFNAFYWVLFGDIYITSEGWCPTKQLPRSASGSLNRYEFINKKALSEAKVGDVVPCSVILELTDDDNNQFRIERSVSAKRKESDNWDKVAAWSVTEEIVKVTFETRTGTKTVMDDIAEGKIAELFPEGIRGYIWFQGESLDTLIDFRKKENLKDAVNHISYYPYYEKLSDIITLAKRKIEKDESKHLKEANRQNQEAKGLISRRDYLRGRIETEEDNKKRIEGIIDQIKIALAEDEGKISGLAGFTGLVKDYDDCEKEIANINNELTNLDNRQRELLPSLWILRGTNDMIRKCKGIIKSHVEEEYTAPEKKYLDNPSRAKLEEILRNKVCYVCGSHVDEEHYEAVEYIQNRLRLQDDYLREMEEYTTNLEQSKQFNMFVGKIQDYPDSLLVSLGQIDKQYGDLEDKISPYLRPLYDSMNACLPREIVHKLTENDIIEVAPLAYMRGRTLNNSAVILDEAQNTTVEQMKMFLTRMGENSKVFITGDASQIDLPRRLSSGLVHAMKILGNIPEISLVRLNGADVVRSSLVRKIVQAYESEEKDE